MAKTNPFTFFQQVRAETSKVTWPSRRETSITTVMVFIMVAVASLFFLAADQLMSWVISLLLGF
ncbi:preprotein translocase subunit SecE [Rhodobacteraceae bacterium RKSG542]|uniref:preprotein translocase subunit SecE n=1 Tax=Pseudovibrio flavus TaxID=2529854 RepID=UPI0012BD2CA1|nr:preprotein translocase subunit SecE [Pseudovibrio flavus]MTI15705.1 preprotein translocase subunit SecE [Pseudovibrio flavus]